MRVAPWQENKTLLKIARCTSKHSSSCSKLSSKPWVILYHPNCSYRENFGITITWCGQVPLTPMLTSKFRYYNNLMVFVPSLRLKKKRIAHWTKKKGSDIRYFTAIPNDTWIQEGCSAVEVIVGHGQGYACCQTRPEASEAGVDNKLTSQKLEGDTAWPMVG